MEDAEPDEAPSSRSSKKQQQQQPLPSSQQPAQFEPPQRTPRQPEVFSVTLTPTDSDGGDGGGTSIQDARGSLSSLLPQRLQRVMEERDRQRRAAKSSTARPAPAAVPAPNSSASRRRDSVGRGLQQQPSPAQQNRLLQLRRGSAPALAPQPPAPPPPQSQKSRPPAPTVKAASGSNHPSRPLPSKHSVDQRSAPRRSPAVRQQPQPQVLPVKAKQSSSATTVELQQKQEMELVEQKHQDEAPADAELAKSDDKQDAASEAGTYTISESGGSRCSKDLDSDSDIEAAAVNGQELELKSATTVGSTDTVDAASSAAADPLIDTSGLLRETADALQQLESRLQQPRLARLSSLRYQPVLAGAAAAICSPRRQQRQQQQQQLQRFEYGRHSLKLRTSWAGGLEFRHDRLAESEGLAGRSAFTEVTEYNPSPTLTGAAAATAAAPQAESHLLACSLHQLSKKLHRCADDLLAKLQRRQRDGGARRTPSPEPAPPRAPASAAASCSSIGGSQLSLQTELLGCLRHLQAVQLQVQALDRAIFPGQATGVGRGTAATAASCSEIDYLVDERDRINRELRGYEPIEPAFPATQMSFYTDYRYH